MRIVVGDRVTLGREHRRKGPGHPNGDGRRERRSTLPVMDARIDHLLDEALALGRDDRTAVAAALLDSLDGEDEETVSAAWPEEIRRRAEELRQGAATTPRWADARARLIAM